ncbi:ATP-grasp domain-containing protein [Pseudoalteromonas umbrosa]|uniref:ATP-grasp domain-containing protein n=1 Tax=Pseudoalteromonas umbrosa TaxID=3048489 RepID=UPI0024C37DB3|nr:ATP-grasp domain-containing protein [Pseudoalteromonas sp. B95]MDK1290630.1 ATP-grasp domain-containing protein [Pseudoalteromonas sp. B95]
MNIVILNNFWQYENSDRWDFELVEYDKWFCHQSYHITYIVNERGRSCVTAPESLCSIYEVTDFKDAAQLEAIMAEVIACHGPVDRVIAFSENLLTPAAMLREKFAIFGPKQQETERFRNKVVMKELVARAGLRVPKFIGLAQDVSGIASPLARFIAEVGFPLILKPVDGASSIGVKRIDSQQQLDLALEGCTQGQWQLEEFIEGEVYHVDGLVDAQGQILFSVSSRYINTCLEFSFVSPLGSTMVDPNSELHQHLEQFSQASLDALTLINSAFHLEVFVTADNEIIFLEVGARVAGADVPYVIAHNTGINLFSHWVDLIVNQHTEIQPTYRGLGAWLMFGLPEQLPQKVLGVSQFMGRVSSVYRQFLPESQSLLFKEGGYCSLQSGRFLFSNQCALSLQADVNYVVEQFQIELQPVEESQ